MTPDTVTFEMAVAGGETLLIEATRDGRPIRVLRSDCTEMDLALFGKAICTLSSWMGRYQHALHEALEKLDT